MGVDYTAQYAVGVKLTPDDVERLEERYEYIDEMFYEEELAEYSEHLEVVNFGSQLGGDVEVVIAVSSQGVGYEAVEVDIHHVTEEAGASLIKFCIAHNITGTLKAYVGLLQW